MKGTVKIVTIGGGSSYTPELMEGFIKRYEELPIKEIWLVDIEDGKEKVGFSLNGKIKRSDFNFAPGTSTITLSDDINLNIEVEANEK